MAYTREFSLDSLIQEITLPYIHPKIDTVDLKRGKGKLLPQKEIDQIHEAIATKKVKVNLKESRITRTELMKAGIFSPYNIAFLLPKYVEPYQLIAIYDGSKNNGEIDKTLGKGTFGKVKLGQNLRTGELVGIKTLSSVLPAEIKKQKNEMRMLDLLGLLLGTFNYTPLSAKGKKSYERLLISKNKNSNPVRQYKSYATAIVFKLAPGERLDLIKFNNMSLLDRTYLAIRMVAIVKALHALGILHLDIKIENFIYDELSDTLSLIDYGESLRIDARTKSIIETIRGSLYCMPPELQTYFDPTSSVRQFTYTTATDVYTLGLAVSNLFSETLDSKKEANNAEFQKLLTTLLQQMTKNSPHERSTLFEADFALHELLEKLLKTKSKRKVAIVNVDEYFSPSVNFTERTYLETALTSFDEIILLSHEKNIDPILGKKYLQEFRLLFKDTDVRVSAFFYSSCLEFHTLVANTPQYYEQKKEMSFDWHYVTTQPITEKIKSAAPQNMRHIQLTIPAPLSADTFSEADTKFITTLTQEFIKKSAPLRITPSSKGFFSKTTEKLDKEEREKTSSYHRLA